MSISFLILLIDWYLGHTRVLMHFRKVDYLNLYKIAECINVLGKFCGMRDIVELSCHQLQQKYNISQADMLILFGGSIPCGGDVAGNAMIKKISERFMIVGGEGHTTQSLRQKIKDKCPNIDVEGKMEADVFFAYIENKYELHPDYTEKKSTNCGNNVTNALEILKMHNITPKHIILIQDATMQRRMDAGFRKYVGEETTIINYASYDVNVVVDNGELAYEDDTCIEMGMWDIKRYITLLMGEIPRLYDNKDGYGPAGKGFISHVEVPDEVLAAFDYLKKDYGDVVREANPLYASEK